jgi:hypothetical protein
LIGTGEFAYRKPERYRKKLKLGAYAVSKGITWQVYQVNDQL